MSRASTSRRACAPFTPSQAVLAKSAGVFHWTPEGRKLFDFSSGVLVANLGHNPASWMKRYLDYMGWSTSPWTQESPYFRALPMTAYNGITPVEIAASKRLTELLQGRPGGKRLAAGDVGCVRFRGDSESALGRARA